MNKKTMMGKLSTLLLALALVWGGVACEHPKTPVEKTYKITFDSDGGSDVPAVDVVENTPATKPADPTKAGYTFAGWFNGDTAYIWDTPVTSNLDLTAKWDIIEYTIEYELPEGSTNHADNPTKYTTATDSITELKNPTLPVGLTFLGWYTDNEYSVEFTSIEKGSIGNIVIYAKYTDKQTFTVTYYIGDKANTKLEEKDAVFTLTGYDLFTDKECTKAYKDPITSDKILYAKVKKMTVKFDSNGGSAVEEKKVDYNTAVAKPTDPTLDGSTFQGWTLDGKAYDFNAKVTKDITLKATWKANAAEEPTTPPAGEEEPEITYDVVTVDGNVKTIERPTFVAIWGCTVKGNVISYNAQYGEAQWTCEDILNYDKIEIYYENQTEKNQLCIKSSSGSDVGDRKDLLTSDDKKYPNLSVGKGKLAYNKTDFTDANENFKYVDLATCLNTENSITITKIVLTVVDPNDIQKEELSLATGTWGWSQTSTVSEDGEGGLLITTTQAGGIGSFGYDSTVDWSGYKTLVFELGDKTNFNGSTWGQIVIKDSSSTDKDDDTYKQGLDVAKNAQVVTVDFESVAATGKINLADINQIQIQLEANGAVAHITACYLTK